MAAQPWLYCASSLFSVQRGAVPCSWLMVTRASLVFLPPFDRVVHHATDASSDMPLVAHCCPTPTHSTHHTSHTSRTHVTDDGPPAGASAEAVPRGRPHSHHHQPATLAVWLGTQGGGLLGRVSVGDVACNCEQFDCPECRCSCRDAIQMRCVAIRYIGRV